ncbi:MAG: helix-turn-helix domain-containing protein [Kosmotoga sp.]|uniref:helix-turn-helix domain-containing protein n=1 Tax=Kosmotoga sp. TaxID=1955248 RepID=UPI001DE17C08|nr:helix-turn-helix domain-containing protein [Kosmotoga sp.]MBO8166276.1 helix-turn-helix domain-containing protein [Kosmotoga sp.]MCD6159430.1 helix-turn-helix domain-containing protein [Kosmotoga sp.]
MGPKKVLVNTTTSPKILSQIDLIKRATKGDENANKEVIKRLSSYMNKPEERKEGQPHE